MALIRWEPKKELEWFRDLRNEVDRLFDQFYEAWSRPWSAGQPAPARGAGPPGSKAGFVPHVNLKETDSEFVVTAEIPGLSRDELDISLTEDSVTLKGERKVERETKRESYHYRETSYGTFQRVIPLPGAIKPGEARATLKDGVLTMTLPKAEAGKRKAVTVSVE
jgi:HSP20 family protein